MHRDLLVRAGVPDSEIEAMRRMYDGVRRYADSLEDHEYGRVTRRSANWSLPTARCESFTLRATLRVLVLLCAKRTAPSLPAIAC